MILVRFLLFGLTLGTLSVMALTCRSGQSPARQSPPTLLLPAHREEGDA